MGEKTSTEQNSAPRNLKINVLILAGGKVKGDIAGNAEKGFIKINGESMVTIVTRTLVDTGIVDSILLSASQPALDAIGPIDGVATLAISDDEPLIHKLEQGLKQLGGQGTVLVAAGDIPLITSEAIENFVETALDDGSSVVYPLIPRDVVEASFPEGERTWVRLRDGEFTGGNLLLVDSEVMLSRMPLVKKTFEARKSPFRMLGIIGVGFAVKFLFRMVSINELNKRISKIVGAPSAVIPSGYAEIGFDVDKTEDLDAVEKRLSHI